MGNTITVEPLSETALADIVSNISPNVFTKAEVRALWIHFNTISGNDETIDRKKFQEAVMFKDSALLDRIFHIFDTDDDGSISFNEYVVGISTLSSKTSHEEKMKFSFAVYDFDGDGLISSDDLTAVLAGILREHDLVINKNEIDKIVEITMKEAVPQVAGNISYTDYHKMMSVRPHLLTHFTLNISNIISEYTNSTGTAFYTPRL